MEPKLELDADLVESCRQSAAEIAARMAEETAGRTTLSVERSVVRFLGVDGIDDSDVPLPNSLVEHVHAGGGVQDGVAYWVGNAMQQIGREPQQIAEAIAAGELDLLSLPRGEDGPVRELVAELCRERMGAIRRRSDERRELRARLGGAPPLRYVLSATGNVYDDVVHAIAVAETGGDVVSMTRSTAQSLLEHVPYGPTTEGFGGTFATQANFRILRDALDEWCERRGRYVRLSSFCSGLCMTEFATLGAMEGLDNMVNDALYGILYRDINPVRTMIDQRVSRMIAGYFGIVINTGEDNYLRTADALRAAPSVTASQFINHQLARESGMPDELIALGDAFEIDPPTTNGLLYEWAQAQLTRELFPDCPIKYMPPTRHMDGNLFRTHACDTLFNLITIATGQGIQTAGVPTEGVFTPHLHDRVVGLECVDYVFNYARDLGEEIQFKPGGIINTRARDVLRAADELLARIVDVGMFGAIEDGTFGDVRRRVDGGRGADGIVATGEDYFNPMIDVLRGARVG